MKPLEWTDRFFLLGKAIRLADRPDYETTVAGFNNTNETVSLHHANNQPMDLLLQNYEIFSDGEWRKIGLCLFEITFRRLSVDDYFRPIYDIPNQYTKIYGFSESDATKRFFEWFDDVGKEVEIKSVEIVE